MKGICKICGETKPLMRGGRCSACMRAIPIKGQDTDQPDRTAKLELKLEPELEEESVVKYEPEPYFKLEEELEPEEEEENYSERMAILGRSCFCYSSFVRF